MITVAVKCVESINIVSYMCTEVRVPVRNSTRWEYFFFFFYIYIAPFFLANENVFTFRQGTFHFTQCLYTDGGPMRAPVGYARRWRPCLQPSRLEFQIFTLDAIDYRTGHSHEPRSFSPLTDRPERAPTTTLGKKIDHGVLQAFRVRQSGPSHD